jgi:hypothetical protein
MIFLPPTKKQGNIYFVKKRQRIAEQTLKHVVLASLKHMV